MKFLLVEENKNKDNYLPETAAQNESLQDEKAVREFASDCIEDGLALMDYKEFAEVLNEQGMIPNQELYQVYVDTYNNEEETDYIEVVRKKFESMSSNEIIDLLGVPNTNDIDDNSPMFLLPNGTILSVTQAGKLIGQHLEDNIHSDMVYVILSAIAKKLNISYDDDDHIYEERKLDYLTYGLEWARLNCGETWTEKRFYCVLPNHMTSAQYRSLEKWIEWGADSNKEKVIVFVGRDEASQAYYFDETFPEDIIKKIKRYYSSGRLYESIDKNNLLDFMYNNLPLQNEIYYWSTFIMPDGRFINISEIDTGDEWNSAEHEEVYNYIYNNNGEMFVDDREIVNDLGCIKLNITYPYIALSDSVRPTPAQYKSLRNWIDNASSEFDYEIRSCEDTGSVKYPIAINKWSDYKIYDLGTMDSYDIIKAIQKSYSSGILESKRNEMKEIMSTSIKPGDRVKMDYYAKLNNGATGTCKGRIGQLCSIEWDDGSKSKEITTYLTKIEDVNESNELEQRARKHKNKSKGMGWHMAVNAGDVEKGIEVFNNSTSLGTSSSSGEGTAMGEAIDDKTYHYDGPIYYRGNKVADKANIYTTAKSLNVAIRNILFKATKGDKENLYQYDIVDNMVREISKEETPKVRPVCKTCGYELNDIGDCPVCDYGEEDLLESLSDLEALWKLSSLD